MSAAPVASSRHRLAEALELIAEHHGVPAPSSGTPAFEAEVVGFLAEALAAMLLEFKPKSSSYRPAWAGGPKTGQSGSKP